MSHSKSQKRASELKRRLKKRKSLAPKHEADAIESCAGIVASALKLQQAGKLREAESLYQSVLEKDSANLDAWHLLGMVHFSLSEIAASIECLERAISIKPNQPVVLTNLGVVFRAAGRLELAQKALESALRLDPQSVSTLCNLGTVFMEFGKLEMAECQFQTALKIDSACTLAAMNLANVWQSQGRYRDAERTYRDLLALNPTNALLLNNLGESLRSQGNWEKAVEVMKLAVELDPETVETRINLGRNLAQLQQYEEANVHYAHLIERYPAHSKPYHYSGKLAFDRGHFSTAFKLIDKAVQLDPSDAHSIFSLGLTCIEIGEIERAESCFRTSMKRDPKFSAAHGALLFLMSGKAEVDPQTLFEEHKKWGELHGSVQKFKSDRQWRIDRDQNKQRKIRVGYVSPDLRKHVVANYFQPVLEHHDRSQFEIFCYAEVGSPDEVTQVLENLSDHWRYTIGLSDSQIAEKILSDEIDILVDLAGHTGVSRLRAFAYRPAPVQVTWIGYPNTTGLTEIDYRITCEAQNPSDEPSFHTEDLYRINGGSFCYKRPAVAATIGVLPVLERGVITFGSLHRPEKISESTFDLWTSVLKTCPESRLKLFNTRFSIESTERALSELEQRGVNRQRVDVQSEITGSHYLEMYNEIDIALDVTPWAGATTTLESLWMGVPVIAYYGDRRSSRSTAAIMRNLGHESLVGYSHLQYSEIAKSLASDLERLQSLRGQLRVQVEETIMNAASFTKGFESSLRDMWHQWCND